MVAEPAAPIAPVVVEQPKTAAASVAAPASKPAVAVKGKLILGGGKAKAAAPQRVLTAEEERERVEREIEVGNDWRYQSYLPENRLRHSNLDFSLLQDALI